MTGIIKNLDNKNYYIIKFGAIGLTNRFIIGAGAPFLPGLMGSNGHDKQIYFKPSLKPLNGI